MAPATTSHSGAGSFAAEARGADMSGTETTAGFGLYGVGSFVPDVGGAEFFGTKVKNGSFVVRKFWQDGVPRADQVVSWGGLDEMGRENVASYLRRVAAGKERHKVFVVGSHGRRGQKAGDGAGTGGVDVRGKPFGRKSAPRAAARLSRSGRSPPAPRTRPRASCTASRCPGVGRKRSHFYRSVWMTRRSPHACTRKQRLGGPIVGEYRKKQASATNLIPESIILKEKLL